jgi:hypothetical protein
MADYTSFVFRGLASLSIEDELRSLGGKTERFQFGERDAEDLAGRIELFDGIENAFGAEARRESERQPGKPVLIDRSRSDRCWRRGSVHKGPWIAIERIRAPRARRPIGYAFFASCGHVNRGADFKSRTGDTPEAALRSAGNVANGSGGRTPKQFRGRRISRVECGGLIV